MTLIRSSRVPKTLEWLSGSDEYVTVGQLLLPGLEAYARVLNPVRDYNSEAHTWASLISDEIDSHIQWQAIREQLDSNESWVEPRSGTIDSEVVERLVDHVTRNKTGSRPCTFLVWEGYAQPREDFVGGPVVRIRPESRRMMVLSGQVSDAVERIDKDGPPRRAMWWIPDDGAWCLGNDIYGRSVFVGGARELIEGILSDVLLESFPVNASQIVRPVLVAMGNCP